MTFAKGKNNKFPRVKEFSREIWEKWQADRMPDDHTVRLREGIKQMRHVLSHHDVIPMPSRPTKEVVMERAYQIDPPAWESYSGKPVPQKREMDRRRTASIRKAEDEVGNWRVPV